MLRRTLYVAGFILLLFLLPVRFSSSLRSVVLHSVSPLTKPLVRFNRSISNTWLELAQIPSLLQQRSDLQTQVVGLQEQLLRNQQLTEENTVLRQELGVTGSTSQSPKVYAHIIIQGSDPLDRTAVLDVGTDQGVLSGQPAVYQGVLIGRITSTNRTTSTVRFITSNKSLIQAQISSNQEKGILAGNGVGVGLSDIEQGISPAANSTIETSGLGGSLPAGILIGVIGQVTSKPSSLSQTFQVNLPYDPGLLSSFFILLTSSNS